MTRRVWTPREQLRPTDEVVTDPTPNDPMSLVEVDRADDAPVPPPEEPTPPAPNTQQIVDAAVALGVVLADAITDPASAGDAFQAIKDARQALLDAAGGLTP